MSNLCNVQILINGQETFFLNEKVVCTSSEKLRKIVKQERKKTQKKSISIEIDDFPDGPEGFEMVSRYIHSDGEITITPSNVSLLHRSAIFLGMPSLSRKTETFLDRETFRRDWSFKEVICCLKSSESLPFRHVESNGLLLERLVSALCEKVAQSSEPTRVALSSISSSSSPETPGSSNKWWWFDDLTDLSPKIVDKIISCIRVYNNEIGYDNYDLALTKFSLHYLKTASNRRRVNNNYSRAEFAGLVETAVTGVLSSGKGSFSCRSLFRTLRLLSGFGISSDSRLGLEKLIGEVLDESDLDDLLISAHSNNNSNINGCVYDVDLVIRLARAFVLSTEENRVSIQKMKKVGKLIDMYLCEISPDQALNTSRFLGVAESVPDSARDYFDEVYRAVDIYLQSHPSLSLEERSKLCRCMNYTKLSLETCKELAKNPKIPPRIAMKALISQQSEATTKQFHVRDHQRKPRPRKLGPKIIVCSELDNKRYVDQSRVVEFDMKSQMSKTPSHSKALLRLC